MRLLSAVDKLAAKFAAKPTDFHGFALIGEELEKELDEGQYFDIALVPELGPLSAAMAVERLARLPYTAEIALSMLVRPQLSGRLAAAVGAGRERSSRALRCDCKDHSRRRGRKHRVVQPSPAALESVESLFAYPMGRLKPGATMTRLSNGEAATVRKWLRVALAAETSGLLQAAIASTVEHLSLRKQFGRPLGTFQALRHRMAECAVLAGGVRWLALKAAGTGDEGDAALAALHAQESATRVIYDVHQMFAAMGMTLEHPLHLWTYRLKALLSELGGRGGQASAVAQHCFGAALATGMSRL